MAQNITVESMADLVSQTLRDLGRGKLVQIAQNRPDYILWNTIWKKDRIVIESGQGIQRSLLAKLPDSARHTGLFAQDTLNIEALMTNLVIPWRHVTASWSWELREMKMNSASARINNIIKPRRETAWINLIETVEQKAWSSPAVDDNLLPYGVPYWVVKNAAEGFNGGAPSGHTTVAGVNLTQYPTFKNYTNTYTAVSKKDLLKKMRVGHRKTNWRSPLGNEAEAKYIRQMLKYFMSNEVMTKMEEIAENQNDNLGSELGRYNGEELTFKRHSLHWSPELDEDTDDPIYGLDCRYFNPVVLGGQFMSETEPTPVPNQHTVRAQFVDTTYNYLCTNRRAQQVFSKAA
jgi:hypothetical protein